MNLLTIGDIDKAKEQLNLEGEWTCFYKAVEFDFCDEISDLENLNSCALEEFFPLDIIEVELPGKLMLLGLRNLVTNEVKYGVVDLACNELQTQLRDYT